MATNAPQDDWHKTGLRLPRDLHHQLHEAAVASGRSYNSEIVARLQGSFESGGAFEPRGGDGETSTKEPEEDLAVRIAKKVVAALRPDGLDLVTGGQPAIKQGPPPDPEAKD